MERICGILPQVTNQVQITAPAHYEESMRIFIGGLTPNITEEEIRDRFSAVKELPIKSVEIILREDGVCKGFGYIDTANDNDEAVAKLIKLFNGAKWRGRFLKVEIAKPSYLDRIQEERERLANGNIPKPEEEIEHIKTEPLSGIENTLMIRKSKRKFLVVSEDPIVMNQIGQVLKERQVEIPEGSTISTKKHRFIQPQVIHFDDSLPSDTPVSLPKPLVSRPKSSEIPEPIFKSTIQLEEDVSPSPRSEESSEPSDKPQSEPINEGVLSFLDDESSTDSDRLELRATASCCDESGATTLKRDWSEKLRDIDEKRKRIEEESGTDEEEESGTNADLQEESQKYQQILASILGKSEPQKETAPVPNAPMSSLFEESEAKSFSLFNFLPNVEAEQEDTKPKETVLDKVAPISWYNEKKSNMNASIVTIPVDTPMTKIAHDFGTFFYRTRSLEEVNKEWETVRPSLMNDYLNKRKGLKKSWNKRAGMKSRQSRK
ncbi:hypothetical protein WA171_006198 [Blastocystis sp. BT1]